MQARPLRRAAIACVVPLLLSLGACTNAPRPAPRPPLAPPLPIRNEPVVGVVQRVRPAVVNVTTNLAPQPPQTGTGKGVGTGFVVDRRGYVATNFHVVEGAVRITVTTARGDHLQARVVGGDPNADLAVLKVDGGDLPTLRMGRSGALRLGQRVVAVGFALGLEGGPSVTSGIVSAMGRTVEAADPAIPAGSRTYEDLIQTDAAINPGNSGGPLVNLAGQVVGINTAGVQSAENIGFAIAIDRARPIIDHAIEHPDEPVAYLGVTSATVTPTLAVQLGLPVERGAFITSVAPGGPATRAGVTRGDVIVGFEGQAIEGSEELGRLILDRSPGDEVEVTVVHPDGSRDTVTATLGVRPLPVG